MKNQPQHRQTAPSRAVHRRPEEARLATLVVPSFEPDTAKVTPVKLMHATMPGLNNIALCALLWMFGAGVLCGQQADFRTARAEFLKAAKTEDADRQKAAIEALASTGDPKAMKDLLKELSKLERPLLRQDKAVEALGRKRKEIWDSIDKQASKGRPVSVGSAGGAIEKDRELFEHEQKLLAERNRLFLWRDRLIDGIADLMRSTENPRALVDEIAKAAERARKVEDAIPNVRILGAFGDEDARASLVGLLATSSLPDVRVAVIDALGEIGSAGSTASLAKALEDPAWPVRVAAARSLSMLHSLDGVPAMIAAMEKHDGRTREEIIESLEDLSGRTSFDNVALWKSWWKADGEKLKETLADLDSDNTASRLRAIADVGRKRLLVGASRLMSLIGLGRKEGSVAIADEAQLELAKGAIAEALTNAPKAIQDRAILRLLLARLVQLSDPDRRVAFIDQLGRVQAKRARDRLIIYAGKRPLAKPDGSGRFSEPDRAKIRLAAVRALGGQGSKEVVPVLDEIINDLDAATELAQAAIESLGRVRVKESVPTLLEALRRDDEALRVLAKKQLKELTGEDFDPEYKPWREWWRGARDGFTPKGAVATADAKEEKQKRRTGFYGIETDSKHIMYIIDRSGSMGENDAAAGTSRWGVAQKELLSSIRSLPDDATFNVVFYNHEYTAWKKGMVQSHAKNRAAAASWIESLAPAGSTNIFDPLAFALEQARVGGRKGYGDPVDTLFFLSDGQPNRGEIIVPAEIIKEIERLNESLKVRIHTIGVGEGHDGAFMRRLAENSGGSYVSR